MNHSFGHYLTIYERGRQKRYDNGNESIGFQSKASEISEFDNDYNEASTTELKGRQLDDDTKDNTHDNNVQFQKFEQDVRRKKMDFSFQISNF